MTLKEDDLIIGRAKVAGEPWPIRLSRLDSAPEWMTERATRKAAEKFCIEMAEKCNIQVWIETNTGRLAAVWPVLKLDKHDLIMNTIPDVMAEESEI